MNLVTLLEERAQQNKEKVFLLFKDQAVSYGEFNQRANQVANSLYQLGIRKGDHVAAVMPNHIDFVYLFFGVAKLGAVNVFIDGQYDVGLLKHAIQICDSKAIVVDKAVYERYQTIRPGLGKIEIEIAYPSKDDFPDFGDAVSFPDLLNGYKSPPPPTQIKPGDPVQFIFTSGTTGLPKPCILSHNARIAISQNINDNLKVTAEDRFYACLPNYHGNVYLGINGALLAGGSMALGERFSGSRYWEEVRKYQPTILVLHITPMNILLKQPQKDTDSDNPARAAIFIVGTGAREFLERFQIKTALACYGATESGGLCTMTAYELKDAPKIQPAFCGRERDDFEVKIFNDEDEELGSGQIGEIVVRPRKPFVMYSGYYNMPDKTAEPLRNLWFHTGDEGVKDEEGFLYFSGRKEESLRVKGNFVPIDHVEGLLRSYPKVQECAIIGVPSDIGEQDIKAYIQPNKGARITPEEIINYCSRNLSGFMIPRYIEFVDSLPISSSAMKVQKSKLKERGIGNAWDRSIGRWLQR